MAAKAVMLRRVDPAVVLAKVRRGWGFPATVAPAGKGGKSGGDGGLGRHSFAVAYAGTPLSRMGKATLTAVCRSMTAAIATTVEVAPGSSILRTRGKRDPSPVRSRGIRHERSRSVPC